MRQMMMLLAAMLFVSCSSEENEVMAQTRQEKLYITIDGMTKTATMVDNAATQELVTRLQQAPVTITLNSSGGFEMLVSPVNELLGTRFSPELVRDIKQEVMAFDGVQGVYDIILHNYGPNVVIGSLHINVDDTMNAHDIHGLTRRISEHLYASHGVIMTIGIYAVATGHNRRAELQSIVMQALSKHKEIVQVHGFYNFEEEHRLSVDVVPDISVRDEAALASQLTDEIKALVPGEDVTILIDHNYSE